MRDALVQGRRCWCGADALEPFNDDYGRCTACDTLVLSARTSADKGEVEDDSQDFYGRDYWFGHQDAMGLPSIEARARLDLVDRIPAWVQTALRHVQPPATSLELGCSHGGFVAALAAAGFAATGLELSPAIAALARQTFGVEVLVGPIEAQTLAPGRTDLLAAMDVLEHLPDPLTTITAAVRLLSADGVLLLQTPCYPAGASYGELREKASPFLEMLLPAEHIYLFSRRALILLCERAGAPHVVFEPAVFAHYDMCAVASRRDRPARDVAPLTAPPSARLVQALLDTSSRALDLEARLTAATSDATQRLANLHRLEALLQEVQQENDARWLQVQQLDRLLAEASTDRDDRLRNAEALQALLATAQEDSAQRLAQVQQFEVWLSEANSDRAARLEQMHRLERALSERDASLSQARDEVAALLDLLEQSRQLLAESGRAATSSGTFGARLSRRLTPKPAPLVPRARRVIAIDVTPILPGSENGGAKGLVLALLASLSAGREHHYLLLTSRANHESFAGFERGSMTRVCLASGEPRPGRLRRAVGALARRWRGVIGHGPLASRGVNLLFCPMTDPLNAEPGIPVVSVLYDLQHLTYPTFFSATEIAHRENFYARLKRKSDAVICISEFTRQEALARLGLPDDRTHTIGIAVHGRLPAVSRDDVARVRQTYGLGTGRYLLYPANGWAHKNHQILLVAFARLLHDRPAADLHLVLTGNLLGLEADLRHAVAGMGLADRVHLIGFVPEADLGALWSDAFCLVYPSLFEGFGIPLLEAMRYDVPVVCSDVASLPEVAGDAALLIDPRRPDSLVAALTRLLDEPVLRHTLIAAGRRRVTQYRADDMAAAYMRVFDHVMQAPHDVREPRVSGVYEDRWLGPDATLQIGDGQAGRSLGLELQVPDWHPHPSITVRVSLPGERRRVFTVARGQSSTVAVPLPAASVTLALNLSPAFVPEGNADARRLTALLVSGRVTSATGDLQHEF